MLNFEEGIAIAKVRGGKYNKEILYANDKNKGFSKIKLEKGSFIPLVDPSTRQVFYIAGPSGSGKSTYAAEIIKSYNVLYPKNYFFAFSRTDIKKDPAYKGLKAIQITIDQNLIDEPINIEEEMSEGCIVLFDDVNTIRDDAIRTELFKLIGDILEVGRKLNIYCVITSHLINPNDKKFARTILNESTSLTVFPKSGSTYQIIYVLKNYWGFNGRQIRDFLDTDSRWITFSKTYPQYILFKNKALIP